MNTDHVQSTTLTVYVVVTVVEAIVIVSVPVLGVPSDATSISIVSFGPSDVSSGTGAKVVLLVMLPLVVATLNVVPFARGFPLTSEICSSKLPGAVKVFVDKT